MRTRSHLPQIVKIHLMGIALSLLYACQAVPAEPQTTAVVTETVTATLVPEQPTATTAVEVLAQRCNESGTLASYSIESDLLRDTLAFTVYLPPCYDPQPAEPYPVIYLLHGQQQDGPFWQGLGIQVAADELILGHNRQPFLIIMPVEEYYFRSPLNNRYPDAILMELLPWVEQNLPVCSTQIGRASCRERV